MGNRIVLDAIETHAEGEPSRIVTSAAELVLGTTMAERFAYCVENLHCSGSCCCGSRAAIRRCVPSWCCRR